MLTVLEVLQRTEAYFAKAGLERPKLDAEWLLAEVLQCPRLQLFLRFEEPLAEETLGRLRPLVKRRAQREPLQYVLGEVEFAGLTLRVDRRALIPRPETEYLVALLTEEKPAPPARILDLGTGTGALALALAKSFPQTRVLAVDASAEALDLARENAAHNGLSERVEFRRGSWFAPVAGERFDWIISNPPYLTEQEWAEAAPEVRDFEPRSALVAADEGLADLAYLLQEARRYLQPGGRVALETGLAHGPSLQALAQAAGYTRWEQRRDLTQRPRYFLAWNA